MIIFKPRIKAIISLLLGLIFGILTSALINTITYDNKIKWSLLYLQIEFWILVVVFFIAIIYTYYSIHDELNYKRALEDKLAIELSNKVVPTVADEMSKLIIAGDYSKCRDLNDLFNTIKSK